MTLNTNNTTPSKLSLHLENIFRTKLGAINNIGKKNCGARTSVVTETRWNNGQNMFIILWRKRSFMSLHARRSRWTLYWKINSQPFSSIRLLFRKALWIIYSWSGSSTLCDSFDMYDSMSLVQGFTWISDRVVLHIRNSGKTWRLCTNEQTLGTQRKLTVAHGNSNSQVNVIGERVYRACLLLNNLIQLSALLSLVKIDVV